MQEAFEKNRPHGRKNKTPPVHSTKNDCLLCARHCSKSLGNISEQSRQVPVLVQLPFSRGDSKRDGGVPVEVADCTLLTVLFQVVIKGKVTV